MNTSLLRKMEVELASQVNYSLFLEGKEHNMNNYIDTVDLGTTELQPTWIVQEERLQNVDSVFGFHGKHMRSYFIKKYRLRSSIGEW